MYIDNGIILFGYLFAMISVLTIGFFTTALIIRVFKGKEAFIKFWKEEF